MKTAIDIVPPADYIMDMDIKNYVSSKQYGAALRPPVSERRVRAMCKTGSIAGARKFGASWMIPKTAKDPRKRLSMVAYWAKRKK